jgi:protein involved in polysaccharide export with SLBB domain
MMPTTSRRGLRGPAGILATLCLVATQSGAQTIEPQTPTRSLTAFAQPGDQLVVRVWPPATFGPPQSFLLDANGMVVMPLIGVVPAGQIPIGQLRDTLMTRYTRYIKDPQVDVTVQRRVTVNGAVHRPDIYFVDVSATLRDVIARAGGVSEVGSKKKVSVIRDGVTIRVPNWEIDTSETSVLRSGDQVLVGRRTWLEINIIPVASLSLPTASFLLSLRK